MGAKPLVRAFCFQRAHILFKAINLKTVSVATSSKGYRNFCVYAIIKGMFYKLVYYSIRKCSYAWPLGFALLCRDSG